MPEGWEAVVSTAYPDVPGRPRAELPRGARRAAALDRRRRRARQGHDRGDDRVRPARDRPRPGVADRRAGAAARAQRRRGGGVARRGGRRVRPLGLRPAGRDRGRDERRARPPHRVRVAARARGRVRRLDGAGARGRPRRAAVRRRAGACRASSTGATPARRSRRSKPPACRAPRPAPALARFAGTGRRFEVSEAGGVTIVDDYGHHPTELAATIAAVREALPGRRLPCCSSRTSTRGRGTSRAELRRRRSSRPTTWPVTDVYSGARGTRSPASPASSSSTRSRTAGRARGVDAVGRGRARRTLARRAAARRRACSRSARATSTARRR